MTVVLSRDSKSEEVVPHPTSRPFMHTQTMEMTSQAASGHQQMMVTEVQPDQTVELGNLGLQSETSFGMTGAMSRWQYGKVPHPVDRVLRELPTVSGLDVEPLLRFLPESSQVTGHF